MSAATLLHDDKLLLLRHIDMGAVATVCWWWILLLLRAISTGTAAAAVERHPCGGGATAPAAAPPETEGPPPSVEGRARERKGLSSTSRSIGPDENDRRPPIPFNAFNTRNEMKLSEASEILRERGVQQLEDRFNWGACRGLWEA